MYIRYSERDRRTVAEKLEQAEIPATDENISALLQKVTAAFRQQFESEAEYLVD